MDHMRANISLQIRAFTNWAIMGVKVGGEVILL